MQNHGYAVVSGRPARRRRGHAHEPLRRLGRGHRGAGAARLVGAVPPRGEPRAPRRALHVPRVRRVDRAGLMPRRDDLHTILVLGSGPIVIGQAGEFDYSGTQGCAGAARRGLPGRAGQLEPGHDHDRPLGGRPHLRRAARRRGRRGGDRDRAARRAAAHARRADRPQPGDGARRRRRARALRGRADRRRHTGDPPRRGPRGLPRHHGRGRPRRPRQPHRHRPRRRPRRGRRARPAGHPAPRVHARRRGRRRGPHGRGAGRPPRPGARREPDRPGAGGALGARVGARSSWRWCATSPTTR